MLYFVIFFLKNFNPTKGNYKIYNKELLAIIKCFKKMRLELKEIEVLVNAITNNKSLEYFMTTKKLIKR